MDRGQALEFPIAGLPVPVDGRPGRMPFRDQGKTVKALHLIVMWHDFRAARCRYLNPGPWGRPVRSTDTLQCQLEGIQEQVLTESFRGGQFKEEFRHAIVGKDSLHCILFQRGKGHLRIETVVDILGDGETSGILDIEEALGTVLS